MDYLKTKEKSFSSIFFFAGIVVLGIYIWGCTNISVWSDELCDLGMIDRPYSYFLMERRDAAPPFHFTILKTFVDLVGFIFPGVHFICVAKVSSVLSYLIIFIVSNTVVRKRFGALAGSLCGLLCMTMPSLFPFGMELRMYSWAITIAFLWFVAFYEFLEKQSLLNTIIIMVLGPLGVFTHYYVVFGIVYAYVFFFILSLVRKQYKSALKIVGVGIGSSVLFLPWLFVAYKSLVKVASNFWLPKVEGKDVVKDFFFPITPDVGKLGIDVIGAVVFGIIIIYFLARWSKEEKSIKKIYSVIGLTMPFAVAIIGILIGKYVFSVFQPRYIMVVMACFWMAFSISVENLKSHKRIQSMIILFLLGVAILDVGKHTKDEMIYAENIEILCNFLDSHDGTIATDDGRTYNCLRYYTDKQILSFTGDDNDYDLLLDMISNNESVYLLHSYMPNVDMTYAKKLEEDGVTCSHIVYCGIEYVNLEISELTK